MDIFIIPALCISLLCSNVQDITAEKRGDRVDKTGETFSGVFEEQEDVGDHEQFTRSRPELRSLNTGSSNLKLAAFNVQIFGTKKMSTPGIPAILVEIILRYDVILIQEIRDSSGKAIMDLLALVNWASTRGQYDITISPRLGRSSSKEQYAFLYRKDVLFVKDSYVYDDGPESLNIDTFEREPYVVHFSSVFTSISDFVLVAVHTSPSEAPEEIDELVNVYDDVIKKQKITDVIILGDLNAACSYMSDSDWQKNRLANDKRFHWLISDCVDTTVAGKRCAYDRFVVAGDAILKAVIKTSAGSLEFDQMMGVDKAMALQVSDHYPIEIQIYSKEMATAMSRVAKTTEYTFRSKNSTAIDKWAIYRLRKMLPDFTVTTTYTKTNAINGVTFIKNVGNTTEAENALLVIKATALPMNVVSLDQLILAEFQLKGAWGKNETLSVNKNEAVKLVCEMFPAADCWISIVMSQ